MIKRSKKVIVGAAKTVARHGKRGAQAVVSLPGKIVSGKKKAKRRRR